MTERAGYTHVVFDIDGTLVDTRFAVLSGLRDALRAIDGRETTAAELEFTFGIPGEEALAALGVADTRAGLAEWNIHIRRYRHRSKLFSGVEELFARLKDVRIGVVTSKTYAEYREEFCRFPIAGAVGTAVCADDTVKHKPDPAPLLRYMELTGARREDVLYVGDSIYDGRCARGAGVDFALATWGASDRSADADLRPESPADLARMLSR